MHSLSFGGICNRTATIPPLVLEYGPDRVPVEPLSFIPKNHASEPLSTESLANQSVCTRSMRPGWCSTAHFNSPPKDHSSARYPPILLHSSCQAAKLIGPSRPNLRPTPRPHGTPHSIIRNHGVHAPAHLLAEKTLFCAQLDNKCGPLSPTRGIHHWSFCVRSLVRSSRFGEIWGRF